MRWPFRRKRDTTVSRPVREWAGLPALPLVIRREATLVAGPAPVLPPLLADRDRPLRHTDRPKGTVVGLATVAVPRIVHRRTERAAAEATVEHVEEVAPPVVRRPVRAVPVEAPPTYVEAVAEFVGEPREPAEPHRAPGWLRFAPNYAAKPETEEVAPPSFLPPELRNKPAPPPRLVENVAPPVAKPMRQRRANLGESRRLGLGAPIPRDTPAEQDEPPAEEPPPELVHEFRTKQQVDVSTVPVYRGSTVDKAAQAKGVRAFTSGGAVFLPDAAGPVDTPKARGLLAHELVHAVQQRALGTQLPSPDSPLGEELEAEAQAAERYYGGDLAAPEPPPLVHAPGPVRVQEPDPAAPAQHAPVVTRPAATPPADAQPVTRGEVGRIAEQSARNVVQEWQNPALHKETPATAKAPAVDRETRRQQLIAETLADVNHERALDGKPPLTELDEVQRQRIERRLDGDSGGAESIVPPRRQFAPRSANAFLQELTGRDPTRGLAGAFAEPGTEDSWFESKSEGTVKQRLLNGLGLTSFTNQFNPGNWVEPEPAPEKKETPQQQQQAAAPAQPEAKKQEKRAEPAEHGAIDVDRLDLDTLSERIYDRLRRRLRLELLVDRERAGLLTDFR